MGCNSSKELTSNQPPNRIQRNQPNNGVPIKQNAYALSQNAYPPKQNVYPTYQPRPVIPKDRNSAPGVWPKIINGPTMAFTVYVYSHVLASPPLGDIPCWTFISQGLSQVNQPEVVFTLRRRQNESEESFPSAPIEWMRAVYALASGGLHLQTGQMCDLVFDKGNVQIRLNRFSLVQDPRVWESFRRLGMLVHGIKLQDCVFQFPGGTIPRNAHHVIALTHEEAAVARQFGPTRVIGHVGFGVRWFPYPPWIDRDRGDCVSMADQAGSIRVGLPVARMYGFNAVLYGDEIIFTIPAGEETRNVFRKYVAAASMTSALCFESFMVPEADAGLIWKAGQTQPMAYGRYSSNDQSPKRTNLSTISFAPQQEKDHCIMAEDGYGILVKDSTWKSIRAAIENSRDIVVKLEDGMRFRLEWEKTVYHNPIDGTEYTAQWESYEPAKPAPPSDAHVQLKEMIFLVQPPREHLSVDDFVAYTKQVEANLKELIPVKPIQLQGIEEVGRQIIVEIEMPKCEGWLKMSASPSMDDLDAPNILRQIAALTQPRALSKVKVQFIFSLWGYQGQAARFS